MGVYYFDIKSGDKIIGPKETAPLDINNRLKTIEIIAKVKDYY